MWAQKLPSYKVLKLHLVLVIYKDHMSLHLRLGGMSCGSFCFLFLWDLDVCWSFFFPETNQNLFFSGTSRVCGGVLLGFGCVCCDLFFPSRKQWFSTSRPVKNAVNFVIIFCLPRKSWENSMLGFYFGKSWENSTGKHPLRFCEPDILFLGEFVFLKPC